MVCQARRSLQTSGEAPCFRKRVRGRAGKCSGWRFSTVLPAGLRKTLPQVSCRDSLPGHSAPGHRRSGIMFVTQHTPPRSGGGRWRRTAHGQKPSTALVRCRDTPNSQDFLGSPFVVSCGGKPVSTSAPAPDDAVRPKVIPCTRITSNFRVVPKRRISIR
jgi:hypothetical protein